MEFKEVIGRRRSIRFFDPEKPVEREKIQIVMKEGDIFVDRRPGHSKEIIHGEPDSWQIIDA